MPKGLRPKAAIKKVLGDFLREGGFTLYKSLSSEFYKYRSEQAGVLGVLEINFNWCPEAALKTANNPWGYKHVISIGVESKRGNTFSNLNGIVMGLKYPHLCVEPGQLYTAEQEEERKRVIRTDPMLNSEFITQEELEEVLLYKLQALKDYGIPWMEEKEELLRQREQDCSGR